MADKISQHLHSSATLLGNDGPARSVCVVDDDVGVRDSLCQLLWAAGLNPLSFPSAETFLQNYRPDVCGCLLLDLKLPRKSGLGLQEDLLSLGSILPVIFIADQADVCAAVKALKAGAFDFLQKPFDSALLLERVNSALVLYARKRAELAQQVAVQHRLDTLTPRETEVLAQLLTGASSKVIAKALKLSSRTVDIYRANVMQKMQVRSMVQLAWMMSQLTKDCGVATFNRDDRSHNEQAND